MKSDDKELGLRFVRVDYCPICGKGWFGKSYIEKLGEFDLDEIDGFWKYKCKACGFIILLLTPQYQRENEEIKYSWKINKQEEKPNSKSSE